MLYSWISEEHPDLNVLVNNAGIQQWMSITDSNFHQRTLFRELERHRCCQQPRGRPPPLEHQVRGPQQKQAHGHGIALGIPEAGQRSEQGQQQEGRLPAARPAMFGKHIAQESPDCAAALSRNGIAASIA